MYEKIDQLQDEKLNKHLDSLDEETGFYCDTCEIYLDDGQINWQTDDNALCPYCDNLIEY